MKGIALSLCTSAELTAPRHTPDIAGEENQWGSAQRVNLSKSSMTGGGKGAVDVREAIVVDTLEILEMIFNDLFEGIGCGARDVLRLSQRNSRSLIRRARKSRFAGI